MCCGDPADCHEYGAACGRRLGEALYINAPTREQWDALLARAGAEESQAELDHGGGEGLSTLVLATKPVPLEVIETKLREVGAVELELELEPAATAPAGADADWVATHAELLELHVVKSSTYGDEGDRFRNFTDVAHAKDEFPEEAVLGRIIEKASRSLTMLRSGRRLEVREYGDMGSLALIAEALRRKAERGEL